MQQQATHLARLGVGLGLKDQVVAQQAIPQATTQVAALGLRLLRAAAAAAAGVGCDACKLCLAQVDEVGCPAAEAMRRLRRVSL